jgi:hypothetical protein
VKDITQHWAFQEVLRDAIKYRTLRSMMRSATQNDKVTPSSDYGWLTNYLAEARTANSIPA